MNNLKLLISLFLLLALNACAPRGENHSVDQVLSDAQAKFAMELKSSASPANDKVKSLSDSLEKFMTAADVAQQKSLADALAFSLEDLITKAGYTSRPAMSELALQYQNIAKGSASEYFSKSSAKLLVARTYIMLSSELETTAFRL